MLTAAFYLNANAFGKTDRAGFLNPHPNFHRIGFRQAQAGDIFGECFDRQAGCCFGMLLGFFCDGAVIDAVGDVIGGGCLLDVGEDDEVDQDLLGFFPFPIVNPDDAAGDQIFDDDFIH